SEETTKRLEKMAQNSDVARVVVLSREKCTIDRIEQIIRELEPSVIFYTGHIKEEDPQDAKLTLHSDQTLTVDQWCELLEGAERLQLTAVLGCNSGRSFALPTLARTRATAFVGMNFNFEAEEIVEPLGELLKNLQRTGQLDQAYLAFRNAFERNKRALPRLDMISEIFELITQDPQTQLLIGYCREMRHAWQGIDVLGMGDFLGFDLRHDRDYVERTLAWEERVQRAFKPGQELPRPPISMHEGNRESEWVSRQLQLQQLIDDLLVSPKDNPTTPYVHAGLEGGAGVGKSTLTQHLAWMLAGLFADHPLLRPIPIYITLRDKRDAPRKLLRDYQAAHNLQHVPDHRLVVLFDGLDELSRMDRAGWVRELSEAPFNAIHTIISSRPEVAQSFGLPHFDRQQKRHRLTLELLKLDEVIWLVRRCFGKATKLDPAERMTRLDLVLEMIQKSAELQNTLRDPFMAVLLCLMYGDPAPPAEPPQSPTDLLTEAISRLISRRNLNSLGKAVGPEERLDGVHIELFAALAMAEQIKRQHQLATAYGNSLEEKSLMLSVAEAAEVIEKAKESCEIFRSLQFLNQHTKSALELLELLAQRSGLLKCTRNPHECFKAGDAVAIADIRIREYLAARCLRNLSVQYGWHDQPGVQVLEKSPASLTIAQFVSLRAWDPAWHNSILHLADLMSHDTRRFDRSLIQMLAERDPTPLCPTGDDDLRHRLVLAARCAGAVALWRRDSGLLDEMTRTVWEPFERRCGLSEVLSSWCILPDPQIVLFRPAIGAIIAAEGRLASGKTVLTGLAERLRAADWRTKDFAAFVVQGIGTAAGTKAILQALEEMLWDEAWLESAEYAAPAIRAIAVAVDIKPLLDSLARMICEEEHHTAMRIISCLGSVAGTESIVGALAQMLHVGDEMKIHDATYAILSIGPAAGREDILNILAEMLFDPARKKSAAAAIRGIGPTAGTNNILNRLAGMLHAADSETREVAADAVSGIGAAAARGDILDALAAMLLSRDERTRASAAQAIGGIGAAAGSETLLKALSKMLRSRDSIAKRSAANVAGGIGAAAGTRGILNALAEMLCSSDPKTKECAAGAIGDIGAKAGTQDVLDILMDMLRFGDPEAKKLAAGAIGGVGVTACRNDILDALTEMLHCAPWGVKTAAVRAISKIGTAGRNRKVLQPLFAMLQSGDDDMRLAYWEQDEIKEAIAQIAGESEILSRFNALPNWIASPAMLAIGQRAMVWIPK
ncbi:MAG TPA: hypothetical protein VG722_09545, partial [Tepidisphaeraceae bacterium]|nr:hypothetical protein [Tepidisphaeraceae bacterium]